MLSSRFGLRTAYLRYINKILLLFYSYENIAHKLSHTVYRNSLVKGFGFAFFNVTAFFFNLTKFQLDIDN